MKKLEIVLRTCDVKNIHNDWRIRYCNMPKDKLIIGCLRSLLRSCKDVEGLKLTVMDDHSSQKTVDAIKNILECSGVIYEFISLEGSGYNNSAHQQWIRCKESEYELVYSVEDDYLHCPTAIKEMIESYELFTQRLENRLVVIYPFDMPEDYNPPNRQDFIVHGSHRHWRTGISSTQVLFSKPALFKEYWHLFEVLALKYNGDYLNPREEHFEESNTIYKIWNNGPAIRLNPIPSLALHMQFNEQKDPFIDWESWWDEYAKA
jgi:hypothetical protein